MKTILIRGREDSRNEYIKQFIQQYSIASYNVYRIEGKLTIKEVRELKKMTSYSLEKDSYRVVILPLEITHDAQNALLKILEETPPGTFFILQGIPGSIGHLPTITSRSFVVHLESEHGRNEKREIGELIENIMDESGEREQKYFSVFALSEIVETKEDLEEIFYSIRKIALSEGSAANIKKVMRVFELFLELYPLAQYNNVSKKGIVEYTFLTLINDSSRSE